MKALITHPGRQHSHQAAISLAKAGALAQYWSGVPSTAEQFAAVPRPLRSALGRYSPVEIPADLARWAPWTPALRRIGDALLPRAAAAWNDFAACRLFDRWAARRLGNVSCDAVIACEISARTSFTAAGALRRVTILDAPSFHHATQDDLTGVRESRALHRRVVAVKDAEIALADHVVTVSTLARASYVDAGVAADRVHALPLGADLALFVPPAQPPAGEQVTFLFCGAMLYRKGFDVMAEAFAALGPDARTRWRIAGPDGDASDTLGRLQRAGDSARRIERLGPLAQGALVSEMQRADCLVLPSRHDSYGMVVAEALACGMPVIVSESVGANALVREGVNGWIVPTGDPRALEERLRWCAAHRDALRGMRPACRESAEQATWPAYHQRFAELITRLVEGARR